MHHAPIYGVYGADDGIRTRDLILTKDVTPTTISV